MAKGKPFTGPPKEQFTCSYCGKKFLRHRSQIGKAQFCSLPCYHASLRGKEPHNKGTKARVTRVCVHCGGKFSGAPYELGDQTLCSRACSSRLNSGPNAYNWRGGHSRREYGNLYRKWRKEILARDRGRCRWCASEGVRNIDNIETHHIIPRSLCIERAMDVSNGICLCHEHHLSVRMKEDEYADFFFRLIGEEIDYTDVVWKLRPDAAVEKSILDYYYSHLEISAREVSEIVGCSVTKIYYWLNHHGIRCRTTGGFYGKPRGVCSLDGCSRPHNARGYCSSHYHLWGGL